MNHARMSAPLLVATAATLLCSCECDMARQHEIAVLASKTCRLRAELMRPEGRMSGLQTMLPSGADAAKPEKPAADVARADSGRRALSFEGTVRAGQSFKEALPGGLTFALVPRGNGWDIALRQPWNRKEERFGAVVVRPPAMNYGAGIILTLPHVDLDDVKVYPPTQRFGRFAISEEQFADARRLVESLETNRRDTRAWQEFMRLRERMGRYSMLIFKASEADGSQGRTDGNRSFGFRVKVSVPDGADPVASVDR